MAQEGTAQDQQASADERDESVKVEELGSFTKAFEYPFLVGTLGLWGAFGCYTVGPRRCVITLHNGRVTRVTHKPGLHWAPAWFQQQVTVFTGEVTYQTEGIKVVDKSGVPIVVSAVFVYRVVDVLKAAFEVNNYREFVQTQATAALKAVVQKYTCTLQGLEPQLLNAHNLNR